MLSLPTALVISNSPILLATVHGVLSDRYQIATRTWTALIEQPLQSAQLVIVDVTNISADAALAILAPAFPRARMVTCSLLHDEVHVYTTGRDGARMEQALPSLLELAS
jgi:hypothetical protein